MHIISTGYTDFFQFKFVLVHVQMFQAVMGSKVSSTCLTLVWKLIE